jgi:hypothetical protein
MIRLGAVNVGTPTLLAETRDQKVWSGIAEHPALAPEWRAPILERLER